MEVRECRLKSESREKFIGQSPGETRHTFPVVLSQESHMGTLLLATMSRKTYKVLPTTDAPLNFGEQSFIGGQSRMHAAWK